MKEQFVTFEIALKLKELGFDEECFSAYTEDGGLMDIGNYSNYDKIGELDGHSYYISCLSPLWQQVIDWLREEHKIDIYPEPTYSLTEYSFKVITVHGKSKKQEYWDGMEKTYNTYQEAREQAILKAIELCQNKN